jgi:site-specific recombinase XerD
LLICRRFIRSLSRVDLQLVALKHGYGEVAGRLCEQVAVFLMVMGRSRATVRAYGSTVARYAAFAERVPIAEDPVLRYLAWRRKTIGQGSINLEASALRTWFQWLRMAQPEAWQPTSWPRQRRPPERVVRALSDDEVGRLLAAPDLSTFVGLRDHVIMATLYQCGLRASELVTLELGSILLDGYLFVRGKGGTDRLVPFGGSWYGLMDTYLRQRGTARPGKGNALFVTRHGKGLRDGRSVWVIVNRYARRALGTACGYARLDKARRSTPWQGHYPHLLRASFATELHRRGMDLSALSQLLGHADADTTARYLGVDIRQLRAAAACHPRALRVMT